MTTAWLVTSGSYSDYTVLAVALTQGDAQRWADAYNAARTSHYREGADVEEVELYADGDPLPQSITRWNGNDFHTWPVTLTVTRPAELEGPDLRRLPRPVPTGRGLQTVFARNYPTAEACEAAIREELTR